MKYVFSLSLLILASLSNAQSSWEWVRTAGASADARSNDVAADSAGNVYVAGSFTDSVIFDDGTKLLSEGGRDIFLAKYTPNGALVWARSAGGHFYDEAFSIAVNSSGVVAVTGGYMDTAYFGTYTEHPFQGSHFPKVNVFIAKYSTDGNVLWVKSAGGYDSLADENFGDAIAISGDGQVAVCGHFGGKMMFEGGSDTITSIGNYDGFWAKYSAGGTLGWVHSGGGDQDNRATGIAIDPTLSDVYVTGRINGLATFHGLDTSFSCFGTSDMFVTKVRSDGTPEWIRHAGAIGSTTEGASIAFDDNIHAVYVVGAFTDSMRVDSSGERLKVPGSNGFGMTVNRNGSVDGPGVIESVGGSNRATSVRVGPPESIVVTGISSGSILFDGDTIASTGGNYLFAATESSPNLSVNKTIITNATDKTIHVAYSTSNSIYVAGVFRNTLILDGIPISASTPDVDQAYVAKLGIQNKVSAAIHQPEAAVFPNPSSGIVNVSGTYVSISIFDGLGRKCEAPCSIQRDVTELDCHKLSNGIYIVRAKTALGEEITSRFSIQK